MSEHMTLHMPIMRTQYLALLQTLTACENAYTHLATAWQFHEQMRTTTDLRMLDQLEQAIRAAGGKVIGADGKEVK